jgi:hypothetical protein
VHESAAVYDIVWPVPELEPSGVLVIEIQYLFHPQLMVFIFFYLSMFNTDVGAVAASDPLK